MRSVGKRGLTEGNMSKWMSTPLEKGRLLALFSRMVAVGGVFRTPRIYSLTGSNAKRRVLAVFLAVSLLNATFAPFISAQTATSSDPVVDERIEQRDCEGSGGIWNAQTETCEDPPEPVDLCPNVSGVQETEPCADETCAADSGTWSDDACTRAE